jgi:hypothetical protein
MAASYSPDGRAKGMHKQPVAGRLTGNAVTHLPPPFMEEVRGEPHRRRANLCFAFGVFCAFQDGEAVCPGKRDYDPRLLSGGQTGETIHCTCGCQHVPN